MVTDSPMLLSMIEDLQINHLKYPGVFVQHFERRIMVISQRWCNMKTIVDILYMNRPPRVYDDFAPVIRSERTGLLVIEEIKEEFDYDIKRRSEEV